MFRKQLIKILIHPFFIGLVITGIILFFALPDVSRYKVDEVERIATDGWRTIFFPDLDQDGTSEEIFMDRAPNMLQLMLLRDRKLIEQYNLRSKPLSIGFFYSGDYNSDGYEEIYLLTMRNDSLLLSIIDPLVRRDYLLHERLVFYSDTIQFKNEFPEAQMIGLSGFPEGPNKKLIFSICSGFARQPRNIFRYDLDQDQLEMSPLSGASVHNPCLFDLDGDSLNELLLETTAPGNYQTFIPYSDHSSWLMVLDDDMEFLFPPVEFPGYPSYVRVSPFILDDSVFLAVLHHYYGTDTIQSGLYVYDHQGLLVRSREMEFTGWGTLFLVVGKRDASPVVYVLDNVHQEINVFDEHLNLVRVRETAPLGKKNIFFHHDLDNDGIPEMIWMGERMGTFVIYRQGFKDPLLVDLQENSYPSYCITLRRDGKDLFYAQFQDAGYIAAYEKNPFYYLKYPFALGSWLLVSLAVFLIFRLQQFRARKQYMTRNKIIELQILSLKNQIDPHFTFNILNAIGSLYIKGTDRSKAYNIFIKYSDLLRQTIRNSDKISVSLEEEIRFIENYLELEQIRSDYSFECDLNISEDVDLRKKIPRMLVFSFVENSVKHGVRRVKQNGQLSISISAADHHCQISIRDNGPGLNNQNDTRNGTGKGMQIIDEMIALFFELEGKKISYTMRDLASDNQESTGTETFIVIPD